jgi:hypothetical protein
MNTQHILGANSSSIESKVILKDIIKELISWKDLFIKNFKKIILLGLTGALIGFTYSYFSKPLFTAKLTFVMRSDANSSMISGLAGLSSLLGAGTNAATTSPLDRIVELIGSERIIGEALLTPVLIQGKNDLLINHYTLLKNVSEAWGNDTILSKVKFSFGNDYRILDFAQRKAIKLISNEIVGKKGILSKSFDKKSGVISIIVIDNNENLAIAISKTVYDILVKFYTSEALSSIAPKVDILKQKVDSIQNVLNTTQKASAISSDQGLGLLLQQDRVNQRKLGLKESVLTIMYGEALKNLEQLNFILSTTSPSFSIIDQPYSPIKPEKKSLIIHTIGFFLLFSIFSFIYLKFKHLLFNILNEK